MCLLITLISYQRICLPVLGLHNQLLPLRSHLQGNISLGHHHCPLLACRWHIHYPRHREIITWFLLGCFFPTLG